MLLLVLLPRFCRCAGAVVIAVLLLYGSATAAAAAAAAMSGYIVGVDPMNMVNMQTNLSR